MSDKPENPYDMNSSSFDADKYLQKLLKVIKKFFETIEKSTEISFLELQLETNYGHGSCDSSRHANTAQ